MNTTCDSIVITRSVQTSPWTRRVTPLSSLEVFRRRHEQRMHTDAQHSRHQYLSHSLTYLLSDSVDVNINRCIQWRHRAVSLHLDKVVQSFNRRHWWRHGSWTSDIWCCRLCRRRSLTMLRLTRYSAVCHVRSGGRQCHLDRLSM